MSYQFWENFVKDWNLGRTSIRGWTDPNLIPLLNSISTGSCSIDYIPEPWWGNDGSQPLHSIIINYNPGQGGPHQAKPTLYNGSYASSIVNAGVFPKTDRWHEHKRAMPILDSLHRLGYVPGGYSIRNHLSIELIPWHTFGISGGGFWKYVQKNIIPIYENVICFSANEANRICNHKLHSVVLIRMSAYSFDRIAMLLNNAGITTTCIHPGVSVGNAKYAEYSIFRLSNTRFITIWGARLRNNMPIPEDLDGIISRL